MGELRLGLVTALLLAPLSACALLIDTDALEGNGDGADSGASLDSGANGDGNAPTTGDGGPQGDAFAPTDGVVHLSTKNIFGTPSSTFKIAFDGGPVAKNLSVGFRNSAHAIVYSSPVDASGQIKLPPTADFYQVELRDTLSGLVSYGQATVTQAVTGFTSTQQTALPTFSPFGSIWPQTSMIVGDITGDKHPDLIIPSGYNTADNSTTNPGIYFYLWNPATNMLAAGTPIPLAGRTICGAALLDADVDGDTDIVFTSKDLTTYTFDVCTLANNGTGTFGAPTCVTEAGTSSKTFDCAGGLAAADFDRDGRVDLAIAGGYYNKGGGVTSSKDIRVMRNTTSGFVTMTNKTVAATTQFYSIAVADMNDDGLLDIVTNGGAPSAVHSFLASGDFSFNDATLSAGNQTDSFGGFYSDQVTLGYLDTDTYPDVLLSHMNGPSSVLYGSATSLGAFTTIPNFTEQQGARFHILDLNVDGVPDIVIPYKNRLLANNTFGALWANASNITTTAAPSTVNSIYGAATTNSWVEGDFRFADWDGDGKIDLVDFATYLMSLEVLKAH